MEELYHFRLHYEPTPLEEILTFIKDRSEVLIIVKEIGTRPHLHCVLRFKKTKSTFIQQLLKKYDSYKGNKTYSCEKVKKQDDMIAYCCKGDNENVLPEVKVVSQDIDVEKYHTQYWEVNKQLKSKNKEVNTGCQNGSSLVKKVKSKTWTEKTFEGMLDEKSVECNTILTLYGNNRATDSEKVLLEQSEREIFRYMMRCLGKGAKKINENIVRDMYSGFKNGILQTDTDAGNAYADKLFDAIIKRKC